MRGFMGLIPVEGQFEPIQASPQGRYLREADPDTQVGTDRFGRKYVVQRQLCDCCDDEYWICTTLFGNREYVYGEHETPDAAFHEAADFLEAIH